MAAARAPAQANCCTLSFSRDTGPFDRSASAPLIPPGPVPPPHRPLGHPQVVRNLLDRLVPSEPARGLQPLAPLLLSGRVPAPLRIAYSGHALAASGCHDLLSTSSTWLRSTSTAPRAREIGCAKATERGISSGLAKPPSIYWPAPDSAICANGNQLVVSCSLRYVIFTRCRSITKGSPAWSWSRQLHAAGTCAGQVDGRCKDLGGHIARPCAVKSAWSLPAPGLQLGCRAPARLACQGKGAGIRVMSGAERSVR